LFELQEDMKQKNMNYTELNLSQQVYITSSSTLRGAGQNLSQLVYDVTSDN